VGLSPIKAALLSAAFLFQLAGCAGPDAFGGSRQAVVAWSESRGFVAMTIDAAPFRLLTLLRQNGPSATLTVYIEGDGAPWMTPWTPPRDPTPIKPISLVLASADPAPLVAYLGRPCQYSDEAERSACSPAYWTERRFSPEVLQSMSDALDALKVRVGAQQIRLVGYSGGGVLAALLASRRDDVPQFVTIAAPLDLAAWAQMQDIAPLTGSIDPASLPAGQWQAKGIHLVAGKDRIVPPAVTEQFVRLRGGRTVLFAEFDHECCWTYDWLGLLARVALMISLP
jgi:pimeloyl-ACP methyl ester carboxylesterase